MTALLEMNPSPAELEPVDRPKPMRFAYASGSRPLEGYTIKRGVGRGGFGEVYFAVSDAGKEVALKLIRRNLEVELRGVTHCLNLKHPNLIAVYDIKTDEHDDHWVIMEYVSGASLEDVVDRYPEGMPQDMALTWFEGICAAVAYLHDHGIVHRDLKPANIFLDEGRVKIGDYGLSKFISCSRRSGQTESVGTVHYMAPEIANGRYGREIDSYALGIILYEMLTGRVPFEGESVGEVLMKHLTAEPNLDALDEPFRSVVQGAMAKDPERRITSANEMICLLQGVPRSDASEASVLRGSATVAYPTSASGEDASAGASKPTGVNGHVPPTAGPYPPFDERGPYRTPSSKPADPEPILAAIKQGWVHLRVTFAQLPPLPRAIIVIVGIVAAIRMLPLVFELIPMALSVGVAYGVYRLVRHLVIPSPAANPTTVPAGGFAPAVEVPRSVAAPAQDRPARRLATTVHTAAPWKKRNHQSWRHAANKQLAAKPLRQRADELVTAMMCSAIIAALASTVVAFFSQQDFGFDLYLWTAVTTTAASWAILVPAKLSEGRIEDQSPMRFAQLFLGALVGVVAWCTADALTLELPVTRDLAVFPKETLTALVIRNGNSDVQSAYEQGAVQLPLALHVGYFAFLFLVLRWWRNAEWTRASRVSLWAVAWTGCVAWFVSLIWWYPQPVGMLLAAATAFTVQLSTAWLPPSKRRELAEAAAA